MRPSNPLILAGFILLVLGGGTLIGTSTLPGEWYAGLEKPFFNPPNWIFGPVWTLLYVVIGNVGYRLWRSGLPRLQRLWWAQLGLNFIWSPLFFAAQLPAAALIVIVLLFALIIYMIQLTWTRDRVSSALLLPYAAWVGFASLLNAAIVLLNSGAQ